MIILHYKATPDETLPLRRYRLLPEQTDGGEPVSVPVLPEGTMIVCRLIMNDVPQTETLIGCHCIVEMRSLFRWFSSHRQDFLRIGWHFTRTDEYQSTTAFQHRLQPT